MSEPLLEVTDLQVHFRTEEGRVHALDGVNFAIEDDEVLGIIGESGCGKTVTAMSIMSLLRSPPAEIVGGSIRYNGEDLLEMSRKQIDQIRGNDIAMIYQDPMSSLNPSLTIGYQVTEPLLAHQDISKSAARTQAIEMLEACGLADAERLLDEYPHSLSGGMRQRVVIAMALITEPKLLIADEPTTALDVTIQAQIIDLLRDLKDEFDMSIMFITHDLPVITELADRIAVMYAGNIVEATETQSLIDDPLHPYTRKLLESMPKLDATPDVLPTIEGSVPDLLEPPSGCRFAPRCPEYIGGECDEVDPELTEPDNYTQQVACHLYTDVSPETPSWDVGDESVSDEYGQRGMSDE